MYSYVDYILRWILYVNFSGYVLLNVFGYICYKYYLIIIYVLVKWYG